MGVDRVQSEGCYEIWVIVGKSVVYSRVVVFACGRVVDDREERAKVGWWQERGFSPWIVVRLFFFLSLLLFVFFGFARRRMDRAGVRADMGHRLIAGSGGEEILVYRVMRWWEVGLLLGILLYSWETFSQHLRMMSKGTIQLTLCMPRYILYFSAAFARQLTAASGSS